MKRITVEEVQAAYRETGLIPQEAIYLDYDFPYGPTRPWEGSRAIPAEYPACALAAVAVHRSITAQHSAKDLCATVIAEYLDLSESYVAGYIHGYDGGSPPIPRIHPEAFCFGWEDGAAARAVMHPRAEPAEFDDEEDYDDADDDEDDITEDWDEE